MIERVERALMMIEDAEMVERADERDIAERGCGARDDELPIRDSYARRAARGDESATPLLRVTRCALDDD